MAAGLAVATGLEQKPYAPLWLRGRTAVTRFGDIAVSDNQLLRGSSLPAYRYEHPFAYT